MKRFRITLNLFYILSFDCLRVNLTAFNLFFLRILSGQLKLPESGHCNLR